MILETSFLIDLLRNDKAAVEKAKELMQKNISLFTTAVTVFEIWQGIYSIKDEKKLEKLNDFFSKRGLLDLDSESAKIGGKIRAKLKSEGREIDAEDCMIAGICIKHGKSILTRNVNHYSRIKNLVVESY
ncbi:PIN domain-containing protein [Candidatus Woesearchaeota archaeon]|nr:PIN domain-containing protein [Candidatus Woesearchaeota archaeon]